MAKSSSSATVSSDRSTMVDTSSIRLGRRTTSESSLSTVSLPEVNTGSQVNLDVNQLDAELQKLTLSIKNDLDALRKDPQNSFLKGQVSATMQRLKDMKDWSSKLNSEDGKKLAEQVRQKQKKEIDQRQFEIDQVITTVKAFAAADICFLVDSTGSMSKYITAVKTQIVQLTEVLVAMFNARVRLAFIGYRDIDERIDQLDFTESTDVFKAFLEKVQTSGGGDTCEDVFSGLETVPKLKWENPKRILIHICDAPCHGTSYHDFKDTTHDIYLNGDPKKRDVVTLLLTIKRRDITYCSIQLTTTTNKMFKEFVFIYGPIREIHINDPSDLMKEVSKETVSIVMSGISSTISTFRINNSPVKDYIILSKEPDFSSMKTIEVDVIEIISPTDLSDIFRSLLIGKSSGQMKIAPNPFTKGSLRYVFHGQFFSDDFSSLEVVYKEFISADPATNTCEVYQEQLEIQVIAQFLAKMFNKTMQQYFKDPTFIFYADADLVQQKSDKTKIYQIERRIKDEWQKWNNNSGHVSIKNFSTVLQAFSHWTYHITTGRIMVVDLQGARIAGAFVLTDPAIHCDDLRRFHQTRTNLGVKGIREFFRTHICSKICSQLGLETPVFEKNSPETRERTVRSLKSYLPEINEEDAPTMTTQSFTPGRP